MGNSESHTAFVDSVKQLLDEDISESDDEFWSTFVAAPMSTEDIFEIVSPDHARQLRLARPRNLQALLRRLVVAMSQICEAVDAGEPLSAEKRASANTSIRLLTRLVPFLMEDAEDEILSSILWKPGGLDVEASEGRRGGASDADAVEPTSDGKGEAAVGVEGERPSPQSMVIGDEILYHVSRFLFLPGYTIKPRTAMTGKDRGAVPTNLVDARVVWRGGVGVDAEISDMPAKEFVRTRVEVLRCVLAILSGPLFQSAEEYLQGPPTWLVRFIAGGVAHTANLFTSLMSTVFNYDPVGWGLPYGGVFSKDIEEDLVDIALQILCVIMDVDPQQDQNSTAGAGNIVHAKLEEGTSEFLVDNTQLQASTDGLGYRKSMHLDDRDAAWTAPWGSIVQGREDNGWLVVGGRFLPMELQGKRVVTHRPSTATPPKIGNVYRHMLEDIRKDDEIDLIFGGLVSMLSTVYKANQTLLPNSVRSVGFFQEALVLLWHLLTLNQTFTRRVVHDLDTNEVLLPVLFLLQEALNSPHLVGLLHTASFVLLVLSSERSFAVRLNEPFEQKVPLRIPAFQGSHADLLALTLHQVVSESLSEPHVDALVEMLLTVLCNVSSCIKAFAPESCLKLLGLLERCARPSYLFRSAFTHHGLVFLIEMIDNILQYQFGGNVELLYSVLREKEIFQKLADLRLPQPRGRGSRTRRASEDAAQGDRSDDDSSEWVPTHEWLETVKAKFRLQAILCFIDFMTPRLEDLCTMQDMTDRDEVLRFLRTTTMVCDLPTPQPVVIRTYQASSYTSMWFTSYVWGVIFTRSQKMPLYDWKKLRLITIDMLDQ